MNNVKSQSGTQLPSRRLRLTKLLPRLQPMVIQKARLQLTLTALSSARSRRLLLGKSMNSVFQSAFNLLMKHYDSSLYSASNNVLIHMHV